MSTTPGAVLVTKLGQSARISLNNPASLNALNVEMINALNVALDQNQHAPVIVLSGEGGKAFCAGGDIKSLYYAKTAPSAEYPPSILKSFFAHEYTLDYRVATLKPILVALMDGIVMGGGVGISVHAPIRIATEKSMFAMPEAKIGLFTDVGGGYFLSRLKHNLGNYLGLTGYRLKGADLVHAGVADHFVQRDRLDSLFTEIAKIESGDADVEQIRQLVASYESVQLPEFSLKSQLSDIEATFQGESYQKLYHNLQQRGEFGKAQLAILNSQCPISLRVIFEQIKRGKSMGIRDNLLMDYRIVRRMMEGIDFFEGVKQVLVDKNHVPQWSFKDALTIPDEEVAKYFERLVESEELKI